MKKIILLVILISTLINCTNKEDKYVGNWILKDNICDTINISKKNKGLFIKVSNEIYPLEVKEKHIEFHAKETFKASLLDNDTLIMFGKRFYKDVRHFDKNIKLDGDWNVIECNEKYNPITIKADTIQITIASPITIFGIIKKGKTNKFDIYYDYGAGTIYSQENIIDPMQKKIDYKKAIGNIEILTNNQIKFNWFGITILNEKEKWLEGLNGNDAYLWGEKIESTDKLISSTILFRNN